MNKIIDKKTREELEKNNQPDGINRRDFFKVAAASGAALAVTSCASDPVETLLPYINPPGVIAGKVYKFASVCQQCPSACGLHLRVVDGRVIGIEGNPADPNSKGSVCVVGQSGLQQLYSVARVKKPMRNLVESTWESEYAIINSALKTAKKALFITNKRTSATNRLIKNFTAENKIDLLELESNPYRAMMRSNSKFFGFEQIPSYNLNEAKALVSFGADFLESFHSVVENSHKYADFHSYKEGKSKNYHLHFGSHLSTTAASADDFVAVAPGDEYKVALALINELLKTNLVQVAQKQAIADKVKNFTFESLNLTIAADEFAKLAKNISQGGLAIVGGLEVSNANNSKLFDAVNLLNYVLGAFGGRIKFSKGYSYAGSDMELVKKSIDAMLKGDYDIVFLHNVNLVQSLPDSKNTINAIKNVPLSVGLFAAHNESSKYCQSILPIATEYESFDLVTRGDSNLTAQPAMGLMADFDYQTTGDIILKLAQATKTKNKNLLAGSFEDYIKNEYKNSNSKFGSGKEFESHWNELLQQGGTIRPDDYKSASLRPGVIEGLNFNGGLATDGLKLVAFNSNQFNINAEYGNRGWLNELPHSISQITWDAWAEINSDTAIKLGIDHGDEIKITTKAGSLNLMAYVYSGVHANAVAIPAGLGLMSQMPNYSSRRSVFLPFTADNPDELKALKVGENVLDLLPFNVANGDLDLTTEVTIEKTGKKSVTSAVDGQWRDSIYGLIEDTKAKYGDRSQKKRGLMRVVSEENVEGDYEVHESPRNYTVKEGTTLDFYKNVDQQVLQENIGYGFTVNKPPKYHDPYRFEMVIDLDRCTGCSACVVACYSENNIPVVGKERVALGRHMSWIRMERYFDQDSDGNYYTSMGPATCGQCDNAGCEPVCPVYATYHNPDGINAQVYNRCVGTRYCANNCIYKQRRFNWRSYNFPSPLNLQLNPAVTVRTKGVMEKCTMCVQRITEAKYKAKTEDRILGGDEVKTACQTACPTKAITFGNGADKTSQVSKLRSDKRSYKQLAEMNYRPALTYLSKVKSNRSIKFKL